MNNANIIHLQFILKNGPTLNYPNKPSNGLANNKINATTKP